MRRNPAADRNPGLKKVEGLAVERKSIKEALLYLAMLPCFFAIFIKCSQFLRSFHIKQGQTKAEGGGPMKIPKILAAAAVTVCLTATSAFAAAPDTGSGVSAGDRVVSKQHHDSFDGKGSWHDKGCGKECSDPVEMMKARREKIQQLLKEGSISKEKADAITAKIDAGIKEIQDFNALPLAQKKEKLLTRFKESIGMRVKDGKLTQEKADEIISRYTKEIEQWDGKGYPRFFKKGLRQHWHDGTKAKSSEGAS